MGLPLAAQFFIGMVISYMASRIVAHLTEPDMPDLEMGKGTGHLVNRKSTKETLPLVYGKVRVGINQVFIGTTGSDNEYLHIVGVIGEGPIEGIVTEASVAQLFLDGEIYTSKSAYVYYEIFTGTSTQTVCSTLNTAISDWTDPLKNTAYIYIRLKYDRDVWVKIPDITLTVEGLKLYDPTAASTAYSNNAALVAYDFLTRPSTRGGMGLDNWHAAPPATPRIDATALEACRSYCATKDWTFNAPISEQQYFIDNFQLILNCFRGGMIYSESKFKLRFKDLNHESQITSLALTDDNVVSVGGKSTIQVRPKAKAFDRPNAVKAVFYNEDKKYIEDEYKLPDATALSDDGDYREKELMLLGLTDLDKIQAMCNYFLEYWRNGNAISLQATDEFFALEPWDWLGLTHTVPGYDDQDVRVVDMGLDPTGHSVTLVLDEEETSLYDDTYQASTQDWYNTTLPDPTAAVPSVSGVSHAEEVYNYRGRSFTRWKIDFSAPAASSYPFWDYAEIYLAIGESSPSASDYKYITKSGGDYVLDPVEEGEIYFVKIRSVNIFGVREDFDSCYTVSTTIVGKTAVPSNLSAMTAVANGDSVSIFATPITDADIEGYEVRLGDAWDGGIFISFNKNCSLRLNGVRPGTHTFWMSPKDNAGNYSATPVSATVQVFIPPGFTELATYGSWSWDFDGIGTHDNTEHTTYDSGDALKCSHTSDVLTGTWTSPTQDLNAVEKVRIWGDFLTAFSASATTWNGVAPGSTTWNDLGAALTWNEIFEPTEAGQIQATLQYSTDNSNWDEVDFFEILCAEVEARYIKVEITITDPTLDSNLYLKTLNMLAYEGPQEPS